MSSEVRRRRPSGLRAAGPLPHRPRPGGAGSPAHPWGDVSPTHGRRGGPDGSRVGYLAVVTGLPRSGNPHRCRLAARSSARAIRVPVSTAGSGMPRSFTVNGSAL